jgi:adhesin transport system outer membrane protein
LFSRRIGLVGRQLLWDNKFQRLRLEDARERRDGKILLDNAQRETTAMGAVEAFLDVIRTRSQIKWAKANLANHKKIMGLAEKRAGGAGDESDVQLSSSRYELALSLLRERQLAVLQADSKFVRWIGHRPPPDLTTPKLPQINALSEIDPKENWHYKAVLKQFNAAIIQEKAMKRKYAPRFALELRGSRGENVNGIKGEDNEVSALIVAQWDLIDGGLRKGEIEQAVADIERQGAILDETLVIIKRDAAARWDDYRTIGERIGILENYRSKLTNTVELYRDQFDLGTRPLLSLLDIQNEKTGAEIRLTDERSDQLFLGYRLLFFGGKLIPMTVGDEHLDLSIDMSEAEASAAAQAPPTSAPITHIDQAGQEQSKGVKEPKERPRVFRVFRKR